MTDLGKIPPQDIDIEICVLSAFLQDNCFANFSHLVTGDLWYRDAHKVICEAMTQLSIKNEPIDVVTVSTMLKKQGKLEEIGGTEYLFKLTERFVSGSQVEYYIRKLQELQIRRTVIIQSQQVAQRAYDETEDCFDLLEEAQSNLYKATSQGFSKEYSHVGELSKQMFDHLDQVRKQDKLTGVPSGFTELDRVTTGFQPPDLIIVAARPGMGKTALALNVARNCAVDFGSAVGVFSIEMSAQQLVQRLSAAESGVNSMKYRTGEISDGEMSRIVTCNDKIATADILIDDTGGISIFEISAKAKRMKQKHDIQLIIVDYLQLMSGHRDKNSNREQEISSISRQLKALAKELSVPVIALSQLSREVERRGDKRPKLGDLRESGAIEQDADSVIMMYRESYYDKDVNNNVTEIIIEKNRHGALKTIYLDFQPHYVRFRDAENVEEIDNHTIIPY